MDADYIENQRDQLLSRREKRWSMNSQRLEEIVAELMRPISDVRRSFDTDLSALLEEYLTEAGLRALDAGEDASPADAVAPNFAELALLLQQSANIYGRKVDFLYQHVLDVNSQYKPAQKQSEPGSCSLCSSVAIALHNNEHVTQKLYYNSHN
uniref:Condensin II complex subunit H2 N-terminal domain-containing protein n=1 Tax=Heliothis virescens TaxID=7102 RepID=A0A2A4JN53_HELVI